MIVGLRFSDQPAVEIKPISRLRHRQADIIEKTRPVQFQPLVTKPGRQTQQQQTKQEQSQHSDGPINPNRP